MAEHGRNVVDGFQFRGNLPGGFKKQFSFIGEAYTAVSYTHLDVYKRQVLAGPSADIPFPCPEVPGSEPPPAVPGRL